MRTRHPSADRPGTGSTALTLLVMACRLAVGGILIYASLDKLAHPAAFAEAIYNYRLAPVWLLHPVAHLLPVVELITGAALVLGLPTRGSALLAAGLTLLFSAAVGSALLRGLDISCGCFHTEGGHAVGVSLLWRDLLMLLACLPPLLARGTGPGLEPRRSGPCK